MAICNLEVGSKEELVWAMSDNRHIPMATIKLRGTNFTVVMTGGIENADGHIKALSRVAKSEQNLWRK